MQLPQLHQCLEITMVSGFWLFTIAMVINYIKAFAK